MEAFGMGRDVPELSALLPVGESESSAVSRPSGRFRLLGVCSSLVVVLLIARLSVPHLRGTVEDLHTGDINVVHGFDVIGRSEDAQSNEPTELTHKPDADMRTYQFKELENGLKVVNVHDPKALKAAFAVAVKSGSFNDPLEYPGLAHFCEHMLFLGSKAHPSPTGFDDFMTKNGGMDNAYTASEVTVYFGEMAKSAAKEGSDRLASFFKDPNFDKKFVEKEVHAINSEHSKNKKDPGWYMEEVMNSLADPNSSVSQFHTGNLKTLYEDPKAKGKLPVDALKTYFHNHYCAAHMTLVTFGSTTLLEQLKMAEDDFGLIPEGSETCKGPVPTFADPTPFPPDRLAKWMVVKGTQPQSALWLQFPMPDLTKKYTGKPLGYLDYVLNYEGDNSLERVLQDGLGLVSSLDTMNDMNSAGTSYYIVIKLTKLGEQHLETVLDVLFSYVALLRSSGVNHELYKSIQNVSKLEWNWKEASGAMNTVSDLAERLTKFPPEHLLSGGELIEDRDPDLIEEMLKHLRPSNMNAAYVNMDASEDTLFKGQDVRTLAHYGLKHTVQSFDVRFHGATERWNGWLAGTATAAKDGLVERVDKANLHAVSSPFPEAPKAIADVPTKISKDNMHADKVGKEAGIDAELYGLKPKGLEAKLAANPGNLTVHDPQIWYRKGWVTTSPKVRIIFDLRPLKHPNQKQVSLLDSVRLSLYSDLLGEAMTPQLVDLVATGVSFSVSISKTGLQLSFGGFAPMLPQLVHTVLEQFNKFNHDLSITKPARFKRIRQEFEDSLEDNSAMPIMYAMNDLMTILSDGSHSKKEILAVLKTDDVNLESSVKSVSQVLFTQPMQLTSLAMGNIEETCATKVIDSMAKGISVPEKTKVGNLEGDMKVEYVKKVVKPGQPFEVRKANPRVGDPNDVAVVSILDDVMTIEGRVKFGILGKILKNLAFKELRTKRQLGYIVFAGAQTYSNVQAIQVLVQGMKLKADELEAAIEGVLTNLMPKVLNSLTDEDFDSYVHSFKQELLQPPTGASTEIQHFWSAVELGGQCFEVHSALLNFLDSGKLTKDSLSKLWHDLVLTGTDSTSPTGMRRKMAVKFFAGKVPEKQTIKQLRSLWAKENISDDAMDMMAKEHDHTTIVDDGDSTARERILEKGGHEYFPTTLNCEYKQ